MLGGIQMTWSESPPKLVIFRRNIDEFLERLGSFVSDLIDAIRNMYYVYILHHASHTFLPPVRRGEMVSQNSIRAVSGGEAPDEVPVSRIGNQK
jgi:hypothetical protein